MGNGDGRTRIDLSHVVEDGMPTYPGLPGPIVCDYLTRERSRTIYAPGHRVPDRRGHALLEHRHLRRQPVPPLPGRHRPVGAPARPACRPRCGRRRCARGRDVDRRGRLRRDRGRRPGGARAHRLASPLAHAGVRRGPPVPDRGCGAAPRLAQAPLLVGIDSLNIDDTRGGERPVHSTLLAAGIPICEHLADLAPLPRDGFRFSAVPVPMKGMGTFPVRAYATIGA